MKPYIRLKQKKIDSKTQNNYKKQQTYRLGTISNIKLFGDLNRFYIDTIDAEAPSLDLHLSIANGFVSSKIYEKRDDFDLGIVNFPFLDGEVPRRARMVHTFRNLLGLLESAIM